MFQVVAVFLEESFRERDVDVHYMADSVPLFAVCPAFSESLAFCFAESSTDAQASLFAVRPIQTLLVLCGSISEQPLPGRHFEL